MMMTTEIHDLIRDRLSEAWPGTRLAAQPAALTGGFWASMYRLELAGQPAGIPSNVVFRVAPDRAMGAKELAVQRCVADVGYPTPRVRLSAVDDADFDGVWSVMDFSTGVPPLGNLNGLAALRTARRLFAQLPVQLAHTMAELHRIDANVVSSSVKSAAPSVAWTVDDVLEHFVAGANGLDRQDLVAAVRELVERRPPPGDTVVCHGDLHPFNLLVDARGSVTVVDWTAAICADPAFDVAYTSMLLANPPLAAPRPLNHLLHATGRRLARRFVNAYIAESASSGGADLSNLDWYRALHGTRILIEISALEARDPQAAAHHPFRALTPAAKSAITAVTGRYVGSQ
jgi:aminoglycoside phosphotransferase (APT) family kinase protein